MSYETATLLQEKYKEWLKAPLSGFSANPISVLKSAGGGGNFVGLILNVWKCTITSVEHSIWNEGSYNVELRFPQQRNGPLVVYFKPSIFHPNVSDVNGLVYCPVVSNWIDASIGEILLALRHLLDHPKTNVVRSAAAQNEFASKMYWHNYDGYERIVRSNIAEYHSGPIRV